MSRDQILAEITLMMALEFAAAGVMFALLTNAVIDGEVVWSILWTLFGAHFTKQFIASVRLRRRVMRHGR